MMAWIAGFAIAFGAVIWVLWPLLRGRGVAVPAGCPECAAPFEPGARFCADCGALVSG